MASQLHYLTVQDILWINLQVTGKVHGYDYAKLEEATYYQYSYGESHSVTPQAARFALGFPKLSPIEVGNDATAFIAVLAFLKLNGMAVSLSDKDGAAWFQTLQSKAVDAIKSIAKHQPGHGKDVRSTIKDLLLEFTTTVRTLAPLPLQSNGRGGRG